MNNKILKTSLMIVGLGAATNSNALIIDNFESGQFTQNTPIINEIQMGLPVGDTLGGMRTINAQSSADTLSVSVNETVMGAYSHSQDSGETGQSSITWNAGGADFTEMGTQNAIRVDVDFIDLNGILVLEIDSVTSQFVINGLVNWVDFLFADFVGVDFASISNVSLTIDGNSQAALDASIDSISTVCTGAFQTSANAQFGLCEPLTVPEPHTMLLLGAGLLGLGAKKRKSLVGHAA